MESERARAPRSRSAAQPQPARSAEPRSEKENRAASTGDDSDSGVRCAMDSLHPIRKYSRYCHISVLFISKTTDTRAVIHIY